MICILSLIKIPSLKDDKSPETKICDNYINTDFLKDKCEAFFRGKMTLHLILNIFLILIILSFLIPEFLLLILHIKVCCSNYRLKKNRNETSSFSTYSIMNEDDNSLLVSTTSSKK